MAAERRTIYFTGRVQGVGFRYTAKEISRIFQVAGYVRNLADGRVELVAEAAPDELDRFVERIQQAMEGCISKIETSSSPPTGEFDDFDIRS